jgi:hypothetical protein
VFLSMQTLSKESRTSMKLGWLNEHFHSLPDDGDDIHGRMQDFSRGGQISDCNSLSGLNPLTNRVLNKKNNNLIYILT